MADQVLIHVPLRLQRHAELTEEEARIRAGDLVGVLKDVLAACFDYERELTRRAVCKVSGVFVRVIRAY